VTRPPFDPHELLQALERARVSYVLVGALARVLHGSGEVTDGLDVTPRMRSDNLERLQAALDQLYARRTDRSPVSLATVDFEHEPILRLQTPHGALSIVAAPAGTRGYDDLRRAATRESLGHGLRVSVAGPDDLARMLEAQPPLRDRASMLPVMRRIAELDQQRGPSR
jgi:hypothetical protein